MCTPRESSEWASLKRPSLEHFCQSFAWHCLWLTQTTFQISEKSWKHAPLTEGKVRTVIEISGFMNGFDDNYVTLEWCWLSWFIFRLRIWNGQVTLYDSAGSVLWRLCMEIMSRKYILLSWVPQFAQSMTSPISFQCRSIPINSCQSLSVKKYWEELISIDLFWSALQSIM